MKRQRVPAACFLGGIGHGRLGAVGLQRRGKELSSPCEFGSPVTDPGFFTTLVYEDS